MEGFLDALRISYTDHPKATPQSSWGVVFIHAFPFQRAMWDDQLHALNPLYRCISYDHRGHGMSPVSAHPYIFESFVDDLFGLLNHLKLDQVVLCGLSMGGYVALRAAERDPGRVKGLVLCDTRSESDSDTARLNRAKDLAFIQKEGLPAYAASFARRSLSPSTVTSNPTLVQRVEEMITGNPVTGVEAALVALATRTDTTESLSRLHVPTLVMVGEVDTITPPSAAQNIQQKTAGAKIVTLPKSAHLSNMESPNEFNAALLGFLKSLPSA